MFEIELFICIKTDLALNNQQRLIYHKSKQINATKQCTTCQRTYYHDSTKHKEYRPELELFKSTKMSLKFSITRACSIYSRCLFLNATAVGQQINIGSVTFYLAIIYSIYTK